MLCILSYSLHPWAAPLSEERSSLKSIATLSVREPRKGDNDLRSKMVGKSCHKRGNGDILRQVFVTAGRRLQWRTCLYPSVRSVAKETWCHCPILEARERPSTIRHGSAPIQIAASTSRFAMGMST